MIFPFIKINTHKFSPYFCFHSDTSQQVVSRFIDAVLTNPEHAWAFVSKVHSAGLDLNELRELLTTGVSFVKIATYSYNTKNCITRSVYVGEKRGLLHLRLVKEPDHNGKWKIFGVEQEECRR